MEAQQQCDLACSYDELDDHTKAVLQGKSATMGGRVAVLRDKLAQGGVAAGVIDIAWVARKQKLLERQEAHSSGLVLEAQRSQQQSAQSGDSGVRGGEGRGPGSGSGSVAGQFDTLNKELRRGPLPPTILELLVRHAPPQSTPQARTRHVSYTR